MADQTFAVHCGFFDAIDSDRTYSADEMNRPYRRVISNGVFATPQGNPSTDLQVVESSGMNIICKAGEGLFADKWFENPSSIVITVPNNTSTVPRIDSVLVQVDTRTSGRVGNIVYRTGTPASSPTPPAINQTEGVVEYRLANIRVNAGVTSIMGRYITDRRGSSDCPWVTSLIYQVDTSTLYDQWQAAYAEYFEQEKAIWDAWYAQLTEDLDVSMTLDRHTNTVITTAQTTGYIPIGLAYNHNTDILEVYINGLRAVEGTHYVVVDDTTILVENQLQIGQEVTFVVMRSVISGSATNIMVLLQELESQIAGVAGGTPTVVDAKADMTERGKIYILSSDSKWYYYSATQEDWVIGGTYGGVPTDTTLSISGSAADAKAVGDALALKADSADVTTLDTRVTAVEGDVSDLREDLSEISERKNVGNLFDSSYLVSSAGWTKEGEDYYGTAKQASDAFGTSPYYPVNCDPSKRYVLSFKAMTPNASSSSGYGLAISFVYGDGATNQVRLPNSTNEYTSFTLVSSDTTVQHGGVAGIKFVYSSGGANVWHMKEITLNEGTTPIDYYGELTAVDKEAREGLSVLQDDFTEKTSNIRMPVINFQFDDGVAKDADIVSIFDNYDFKCGFAVPTNISDLSPYVIYQDKGYEVISHSTDGTGMNDASADLSVIEAKLKTSKETLENAGLKIRGFVTPNSIMNLKFRPLLRKYYDWADTISFGTYSGTINGMLQPYMVPVDGVYNSWRVSLQTTTLANAKLAVDKCVENYGCLTFYGHAWALDTDNNLTTANLTSLLNYIADKVNAGECACDIPSKAILNYFNVRNDDISDGWINVSSTDAELDSRLSVVGWDMRYNPKTKLFAFSARLTATEAISGPFVLCKIPVHLVTNAFGSLIINESGKNMLFYNNGVLCQTSTWGSGTSYRMTGFGIFDYVL